MLNILIVIMFAILGLSVSLILEKMNIAIRNKFKYTRMENLIDILLTFLGVDFGIGLFIFIFIILF